MQQQQRRRQGGGLAPLALGGGLVLAILATLVELAQGDVVSASMGGSRVSGVSVRPFEQPIRQQAGRPSLTHHMHDARRHARCVHA